MDVDNPPDELLQPEAAASRGPQPISADDVNPSALHPVATAWLMLPSSAHPHLAPTVTTSREQALAQALWLHPPPEESSSDEEDEQKKPRKPQPPRPAPLHSFDLNKLSHLQLVEQVQRHNEARNISAQPMTDMLGNVLAGLEPLQEDYQAHPKTIGGQPGDTPWTRGWRKMLKQKGSSTGGSAASGAGGAVLLSHNSGSLSRKASIPAAPQTRVTRSSAAAGGGEDGALDGWDTDLGQQRSNRMYPTQVSKDVSDFLTALQAFLDIAEAPLPLLAPDAPNLDLRTLLLKVSAQGYDNATVDDWAAWSELLCGRGDLGPVLQAVYAFYLLPVERGMAATQARKTAALEWLNSRVSERKHLAYCEQSLRPTVGQASRSHHAAEAAIHHWQTVAAGSATLDTLPARTLDLVRAAAREPLGVLSEDGYLWGGYGASTSKAPGKGRGKRAGTSAAGDRKRPRAQPTVSGAGAGGGAGGSQPDTTGSAVDSSKPAAALDASSIHAILASLQAQVANLAGLAGTGAGGAGQTQPLAVDGGSQQPSTVTDTNTGLPPHVADALQGSQASAASRPLQGDVSATIQPLAGVASGMEVDMKQEQSSKMHDSGLPKASTPESQAAPDTVEGLQAEVVACQALAVSWRQHRAALPGYGARPPDLVNNFIQRYEQDFGEPYTLDKPLGTLDGTRDTLDANEGVGHRVGGRGQQQPPADAAPGAAGGRVQRGWLGPAPRCYNCKACDTQSLRRGCDKNRERVRAGLEPVVWDAGLQEFVTR